MAAPPSKSRHRSANRPTAKRAPRDQPARARAQRRRERPAEPNHDLARIAGLAAVTALFAAAPRRVQRLFFDERVKAAVAPFTAELARARKPYRAVPAEELARIAGTPMHGGVVAFAEPRPVPGFDPV